MPTMTQHEAKTKHNPTCSPHVMNQRPLYPPWHDKSWTAWNIINHEPWATWHGKETWTPCTWNMNHVAWQPNHETGTTWHGNKTWTTCTWNDMAWQTNMNNMDMKHEPHGVAKNNHMKHHETWPTWHGRQTWTTWHNMEREQRDMTNKHEPHEPTWNVNHMHGMTNQHEPHEKHQNMNHMAWNNMNHMKQHETWTAWHGTNRKEHDPHGKHETWTAWHGQQAWDTCHERSKQTRTTWS